MRRRPMRRTSPDDAADVLDLGLRQQQRRDAAHEAEEHDGGGRRVDVVSDRAVVLAPPDHVGPSVVAALLRLHHAVDRCLRRERRAPHHDERTLLGGRVLEQLEVRAEGGAQEVEGGDVLGVLVRSPHRVERGCHDAVLRAAGEPRHQGVLRPEVVGRQAPARPRQLPDPGQRCLLDATLGDQRGGGVEQRLLGLGPPLGLGQRSRWPWRGAGHAADGTRKRDLLGVQQVRSGVRHLTEGTAMATYDLVIKGGTVIDGLQTPRFKADVAIAGGRVAQIGRVAAATARRSSTRREGSSLPASSTCTRTTTARCSGTRGARCRVGTA